MLFSKTRSLVGLDIGTTSVKAVEVVERGGEVHARHAAVGHGAQQQLAEEHALGLEVFRVFRAAGDLGDEIGRRVVAADEAGLFGHPQFPPRARGPAEGRIQRVDYFAVPKFTFGTSRAASGASKNG